MAFLDSFKKNERLYILILSAGVAVLLLNNLVQFFEIVIQNKWLSLLSLIVFFLTLIYVIKNREEVFR